MTDRVLTPGEAMGPRLVTYEELCVKLLPMCQGWPWAQDAIRDLWLKGSPVPVPEHALERRILLSGQFRKWWMEIQQRMSIDVSVEIAYATVTQNAATGSGQNIRRRVAGGNGR
jgi:hypothetical protein